MTIEKVPYKASVPSIGSVKSVTYLQNFNVYLSLYMSLVSYIRWSIKIVCEYIKLIDSASELFIKQICYLLSLKNVA